MEFMQGFLLKRLSSDAEVLFEDHMIGGNRFRCFNDWIPVDTRYDSNIFRDLEISDFECCASSESYKWGAKCSDFKAVDSYVMYTNDNKKVYFVLMTYTVVWHQTDSVLVGKEYHITSACRYNYLRGDSSWEITSESVGNYQGIF